MGPLPELGPRPEPRGEKGPRTRVGSWAGPCPSGGRALQAGPDSALRTQLLAFPPPATEPSVLKLAPFPCAGFPGSAEIKAAFSGNSRLRGDRGGCSRVCRVPGPCHCLLWGAGGTAGELPAVRSQGAQSILPAFPTPLPCRGTPHREPAAARLQPQRASPWAEKKLFLPRGSAPGAEPARACSGRGHRGQGSRREGAGEPRGAKEGPGTTPAAVPRSRPAAAACGTHPYGWGHRDAGRTRTAVPQGGRGLPEEATAGGRGKGRAPRPRGNEGVALFVACALWGRPVRRPLSPGPDKALQQRCHSREASGLSFRQQFPLRAPGGQQARKAMPPPRQRDARTHSRAGTATVSASHGFSRPSLTRGLL